MPHKKGAALFKKAIVFFFLINLLLFYCQMTINAEDNKNCRVEGIFYDQKKPAVIISGNLYAIGASLSGGTIIEISPQKVTMKFPYGVREYGIGDSICEKIGMGLVYGESQEIEDYLNKINSLIREFIIRHNENKILFELANTKSLSGAKGNSNEASTISSKMIESINNYRQQLSALSVPAGCNRYHGLTIKLFDIGEDTWKALMAADEQQAEILSERVLRIAQELNRESRGITELSHN